MTEPRHVVTNFLAQATEAERMQRDYLRRLMDQMQTQGAVIRHLPTGGTEFTFPDGLKVTVEQ